MYMVMPYMEHDLSGLLENPDVKLTEPQIKCYMLQLLEGVRYLHEVPAHRLPWKPGYCLLTQYQSGVLHRDMKGMPEFIFR